MFLLALPTPSTSSIDFCAPLPALAFVPKHMRSIMQMSYGAMNSSIGVTAAYLYDSIHWQPER